MELCKEEVFLPIGARSLAVYPLSLRPLKAAQEEQELADTEHLFLAEQKLQLKAVTLQ